MNQIDWPEIYFVRHGQTDWNAQGRYQGAKDIPLNTVGQGQADANGPLLRDLMARDGRDPATFRWVSSPLMRTRETMDRVRRAFDHALPQVTFDDRLIEISFGVFEGALHHELPPEAIAAPGQRDETFWHFRPEKGESYEDVAARISSFGAGLDGPTVIVAHGGILRVLRHLVEGAAKSEVVNWGTAQDAVHHLKDGRLTVHAADAAPVD